MRLRALAGLICGALLLNGFTIVGASTCSDGHQTAESAHTPDSHSGGDHDSHENPSPRDDSEKQCDEDSPCCSVSTTCANSFAVNVRESDSPPHFNLELPATREYAALSIAAAALEPPPPRV